MLVFMALLMYYLFHPYLVFEVTRRFHLVMRRRYSGNLFEQSASGQIPPLTLCWPAAFASFSADSSSDAHALRYAPALSVVRFDARHRLENAKTKT